MPDDDGSTTYLSIHASDAGPLSVMYRRWARCVAQGSCCRCTNHSSTTGCTAPQHDSKLQSGNCRSCAPEMLHSRRTPDQQYRVKYRHASVSTCRWLHASSQAMSDAPADRQHNPKQPPGQASWHMQQKKARVDLVQKGIAGMGCRHAGRATTTLYLLSGLSRPLNPKP